MWHKAIWKGHPMRLELTRVGLLAELANHYTTRGSLSEYMSLHLSLKLTTNCVPLLRMKWERYFFYKEVCFVSFIEVRSLSLCSWLGLWKLFNTYKGMYELINIYTSMIVCVCFYQYVYVFCCMYMCVYKHVCVICPCACMHTCLFAYVYMFIRVCIHLCIYARVCMCVDIMSYACI